MYKLAIVFFAAVAAVSAKPGLLAAPLAYTAAAPAVAAYTTPVVTATSSQYFGRNGLIAAPLTAAYSAYPYASAYSAYPYASAYSAYPYASAYSAYNGYPYASASYVV